jgi:hypothetical protein
VFSSPAEGLIRDSVLLNVVTGHSINGIPSCLATAFASSGCDRPVISLTLSRALGGNVIFGHINEKIKLRLFAFFFVKRGTFYFNKDGHSFD